MDPLRSARRLGPILYQLPPTFKCDVAVLTDFLALLPSGHPACVRVPACVLAARKVYSALEKHRRSVMPG